MPRHAVVEPRDEIGYRPGAPAAWRGRPDRVGIGLPRGDGGDIVAALTSDAGGDANMSEARRQLIRRFAALAVQAESMEARLAMGEQKKTCRPTTPRLLT
jgi:hypothetical protein